MGLPLASGELPWGGVLHGSCTFDPIAAQRNLRRDGLVGG